MLGCNGTIRLLPNLVLRMCRTPSGKTSPTVRFRASDIRIPVVAINPTRRRRSHAGLAIFFLLHQPGCFNNLTSSSAEKM